jgi:hypothetical protein
MALSTHPYLTPRLSMSKDVPLLPLWAFMARSWVNFTFTKYLLLYIIYNLKLNLYTVNVGGLLVSRYVCMGELLPTL